MSNFAELGIKVDSSPAVKAAEDLDKLVDSADQAEQAIDNLSDASKGLEQAPRECRARRRTLPAVSTRRPVRVNARLLPAGRYTTVPLARYPSSASWNGRSPATSPTSTI
ncbi:phage tail tape measure protein lambda [Pseudomonas aeruginosa]|nr:phage tail tape measure protein lambda [Pseudomonas aeruginosa]